MAAGAKIKLFEQGTPAFTMPEPQARTYLDFNATAPLRPAVRDAVLAQMVSTGNPSSIHAEGRAARAAVEQARAAVGHLAGVPGERVTFTSGATEALVLALHPSLGLAGETRPAARLLVGATEHAAVLRGHRFPAETVETVPVDEHGRIRLEIMADLLARPGRALVAIQAANSETGVIQPIADIAGRVREAGGLLVCDAVQAAGRMDARADALGADAVVFSAHKIGGPQGVGALVLAREGLQLGVSLVRGGGQERGLRGGTENGPGIVGFGVAAREAASFASEAERLRTMRDRFEAGLRSIAADAVVFGASTERLPNTVAFSVPGAAADTLLIGLDLEGIAVSTGSACSSGKVSRSSVLEAMGVNAHLSRGMVRVSLGWSSSDEDVDRGLGALETVLRRMHGRPLRVAA